ncbi:MAG TPA: ABC transporter substrate-binding protein [Alphaproteobacteria bacterium]|nr:ABC transporter substrate-binding protein [Alphaproteobacteria bacterium]
MLAASLKRMIVAVVALTISAPLVIHDAKAQGAMDRILRDKELKIGFIPAPPGTIEDPKTGNITGYYVDGMRFVAQMIGVKPVFIETTWANFAAGLNSGQFDVSIAGTFATIQRAGAVEFTIPINYLGYSAVAKKGDTRFKTPADLNRPDIKIALVQGGASNEYAKMNWPKAQFVFLATGNLTAPFVEVSAGRADVGVEDAWQARRYTADHPEVVDLFGDHPYNVLPIAWSVKRGNEDLLNFLNTAINYLLETGTWEKMSEKYGPTGRFWNKPNLVLFGVTEAAAAKKQ